MVSWNHNAFNSQLPWQGFEHIFINIFTFKKNYDFWYRSVHSVTTVCLVDTPKFQSFTSNKPFLITKHLHHYTHLQIIPDGVCYLQDHNVSNLQIPFSVCPFLLFLKRLQEFVSLVTPKFIQYVLNLPPSSVAV